MYKPKHFDEKDDATIHEFIQRNSFATLISIHESSPVITHIPLDLTIENEKVFLAGHVAKANPHWKLIEKNNKVTVVFSGPQGYISSKWYDHINVPTWNYAVAHVRGTASTIHDEQLLRKILQFQIDKYESESKAPLRFEDLPDAYVSKEIKGIVGIRIEVEEIDCKFKLSQNRDVKNFENIIAQLDIGHQGGCPLSEEMRKQIKKIGD